MSERVDLYESYGRFDERVLAEIRAETFGEDIGQNSWLTADELARFAAWLELAPRSRLLEVASGSGGPALHLARTTGCSVVGIDSNELRVATAERRAAELAGGTREARAGAFRDRGTRALRGRAAVPRRGAVERLSSERRLSRIAYLVERS